MALKFNCPKCQNDIIVKFLKSGDMARCPKCQVQILIPTATIKVSDDLVLQPLAESQTVESAQSSESQGLRDVDGYYVIEKAVPFIKRYWKQISAYAFMFFVIYMFLSIKHELKLIRSEVSSIESDVSSIESDVSSIESDVSLIQLKVGY